MLVKEREREPGQDRAGQNAQTLVFMPSLVAASLSCRTVQFTVQISELRESLGLLLEARQTQHQGTTGPTTTTSQESVPTQSQAGEDWSGVITAIMIINQRSACPACRPASQVIPPPGWRCLFSSKIGGSESSERCQHSQSQSLQSLQNI